MNLLTLNNIVSAQHKGRKAKVQVTANCYSVGAASGLYEYMKVSLVDVCNWSEFKSGISFHTKLVNNNGQPLKRSAHPGDLIKIRLPRCQTAGRMYDWRKITRIEERLNGNTEIFFMTIAPSSDPDLDVPEPAHLLRPESTVTFFVIRDEQHVQLEIYTRNEEMNVQLSGFKTRLQNTIMSIFIAGGFYDSQWKKLMKSILRYGMAQMKVLN